VSATQSGLDIFAELAGEAGEDTLRLISSLRGSACPLDVKTRELIGLAIMAALRLEHSMRVHMPRAVAAGATRDEIVAALMQSIPLAGMLGPLMGLRVAEEILAPSNGGV
jgi:4-carboxymuconolactone decarboxylase